MAKILDFKMALNVRTYDEACRDVHKVLIPHQRQEFYEDSIFIAYSFKEFIVIPEIHPHADFQDIFESQHALHGKRVTSFSGEVGSVLVCGQAVFDSETKARAGRMLCSFVHSANQFYGYERSPIALKVDRYQDLNVDELDSYHAKIA